MQMPAQLSQEIVALLAALGVRAAAEAIGVNLPPNPFPTPSPETGGLGLDQLARAFRGEQPDGHYAPSSPFGAIQGPLPPDAPRFPAEFPPAGWVEKIRNHATGVTTSRFAPSAEATQIKADRKALEQVLRAGGADEVLGARLGGELLRRFQQPYTGRFGDEDGRVAGARQHPDEARLQRGMIILESLKAEMANFNTPQSRKILQNAMLALSPKERADLLEADEYCGRQLYSALYTASQENPEFQASFLEMKTVAQQARIAKKLNAQDPSGQAKQVVLQVLDHLEAAGVPFLQRQEAVDKILFKLTLQPGQINALSEVDFADIPPPDTTQAEWREVLAARVLNAIAESPKVDDDSLRKTLDMPIPDLMKTLAHAFTGSHPADNSKRFVSRREGDFRIVRLMRETATGQAREGVPGWSDVCQLLDKLETGEFNRQLFLELAQAGTAVPDILQQLNHDRDQKVVEIGQTLGEQLNARLQRTQTEIVALTTDYEQKSNANPPNEVAVRKALAKLDEARNFAAEFQNFAVTPVQVRALVERFGRAALEPQLYDREYYRQLKTQIAAVDDPLRLKAGLDKMSLMLPTAGKELKDFPWLASTVDELLRIAQAVRAVEPEFCLKPYPIIILDQTDGNGTNPANVEKWQRNDAYIRQLKERYADFGLEIEHVSMGNIRGMLDNSGVEKMFDTTGENNPGYGGARNMAFLLTPVIRDALRRGERVTDIPPDELARRIKDTAMGQGTKVFQGDDTDYVGAGSVASKAAMSADPEFQQLYSTTVSKRGGRDTQNVSDAFPVHCVTLLEGGGLDAAVSHLFKTNAFKTKETQPGMGCSFGSPRFCLDLPTGAEEKHHEATVNNVDMFCRNEHLSGDRQAPTAEFMQSFLMYSTMSDTTKQLFQNLDLPWNQEKNNRTRDATAPIGSLGEVFTVAADPVKRAQLQKVVLGNLVKMNDEAPDFDRGLLKFDEDKGVAVDQYLAAHPEVDAESREQLQRMRNVFTEAKRQADLAKTLITNLFNKLAPGANTPAEKRQALHAAVDHDPDDVLAKIRQVRQEMEAGGVPFNGANRMVRDLYLIIESLGGGAFSQLAQTFVNA